MKGCGEMSGGFAQSAGLTVASVITRRGHGGVGGGRMKEKNNWFSILTRNFAAKRKTSLDSSGQTASRARRVRRDEKPCVVSPSLLKASTRRDALFPVNRNVYFRQTWSFAQTPPMKHEDEN